MEVGLAWPGARAEPEQKHLGKACRLGIFSHVVQGWRRMDPVAILSSQGKQLCGALWVDWGTPVRSSGPFLSTCFVLASTISLKTDLERVWPWCHRHGFLGNREASPQGNRGLCGPT